MPLIAKGITRSRCTARVPPWRRSSRTRSTCAASRSKAPSSRALQESVPAPSKTTATRSVEAPRAQRGRERGEAQGEARAPAGLGLGLRAQQRGQPGAAEDRPGAGLAGERRRGVADQGEGQLDLRLEQVELAGEALADRLEVEVASQRPQVAASPPALLDLATDRPRERLSPPGRVRGGVDLGLDRGQAALGRRVLVAQPGDHPRRRGHQPAEPGPGLGGRHAPGQRRDRRAAQARRQRALLGPDRRRDRQQLRIAHREPPSPVHRRCSRTGRKDRSRGPWSRSPRPNTRSTRSHAWKTLRSGNGAAA